MHRFNTRENNYIERYLSLGALWFCANCKKDVIKLAHVNIDLEKLYKRRLDKMEKKLADLNHKLDEKS